MMGKTRKRTLVALLASVFLLASAVPSQAALDWRTREEMNIESAVAAKDNLLPNGMFTAAEESTEPRGWDVNGGEVTVSAGDGANGTNSVAVPNASYIISESIPTYGAALLLMGYYHVPSVPENTQVKLNIQIYGNDAEGNAVKVAGKGYCMSTILTIEKATDDWTFFSYELPKELNETAIATLRIWLRNTTSADAEAAVIKFSSVRVCTNPWEDVPENLIKNWDFQECTEADGLIIPANWTFYNKDSKGVITAEKENDGNVYVAMSNSANVGRNTGVYQSTYTEVEANGTYRVSFSMKNTTTKPSVRVYFYDSQNAAVGLANKEITMNAVEEEPKADVWTEYEGFFTAKGIDVDANAVTQVAVRIYCTQTTNEIEHHIDNVKLIKTSSKIEFADAEGEMLEAVPASGTASVEAVLLPKMTGKAPTLFICEYTAEKQLKQIVFGTVQELNDISSISAAGYQYKGTAVITGVAATSTLKAFAWDGLSGMQPIALKILRSAEG